MPTQITRQEKIDDMLRVASLLGRSPTVSEYLRLGKYSPVTLHKEFGSWENVLLSSGMKLGPKNRKVQGAYSELEVNKELDRIGILLGHFPTLSELKQYGNLPFTTLASGKAQDGLEKHNHPLILPDWSVDVISPEDGAWIAGIITGEGSFIVNHSYTDFRIGLRADDREVLEFIKKVIDLPNEIRTYSNRTRRLKGQLAGDEARLFTSNRQVGRARVVPFFDRFPLRGRKALDFAIYREVVMFLAKRDDEGFFHKRLTVEESLYLGELTSRLKALRKDPTAFLKE